MFATVVRPLVPMQLGGSAGSSPAVSSATSCLVEGKCCVCVPHGAHFHASVLLPVLAVWGRRTRSSVPAVQRPHAGTGGALEDWHPVPGELSHSHHLGDLREADRDTSLTWAKCSQGEGRGHVWSGTARMHRSPAVPLCRNVLSLRRWVKSWKIAAGKGLGITGRCLREYRWVG